MQQQMADKLAAVLEHFVREVGRWLVDKGATPPTLPWLL